jgi:hypothetical protein
MKVNALMDLMNSNHYNKNWEQKPLTSLGPFVYTPSVAHIRDTTRVKGGPVVTEQELIVLLRSQGWSLGKRKTGKQYAFDAKKYKRGGNITRYIAVSSTLKGMTAQDVLAKLNKPTKAEDSNQ